MIGGYYVADLTGSGTVVAAAVGLGMFGGVLGANASGLRISSGFQLVLASILVVVIAAAVGIALPGGDNWAPFAPHGVWAVGTAANILVWLFVGWKAVAQLAGEFRRPERDLPRSVALAFAVVTVLYCGLAAATVAVTAGTDSRVPLADLIAVGFGRLGRDATAVLAVALTMGTMNVYVGGAAKLAASPAGFSGWFLTVPATAAAAALVLRRMLRLREGVVDAGGDHALDLEPVVQHDHVGPHPHAEAS